jgi:HD-GYP domain-containing protein (c-di-GMP phosphodiesterase class II)
MSFKKDLRFVLSVKNPGTLSRVSAIVNAFSSTKEILSVNSLKELDNEIKKNDPNNFFVIDLCDPDFLPIGKSIASNFNNGMKAIYIIDEQMESSPEFQDYKEITINKDFKIMGLSSLISDVLAQNQSEYFPIKVSNFYKTTEFPCDVYVRLGPIKFVRIAHEASLVEKNFVEKYEQKNITEFYVTRDDFYRKCESLFELKLAKKELFDRKEEHLRKNQEILHEMVSTIGVNQFVVESVNECMTDVDELMQKPELKNVFSLFKASKGTFLYDHSYLSIIFSHLICKHMSWESKQIRDKLAQACMFHDLALKSPKYALLESLGRKELNTMEKQMRDEILSHGVRIAELVAVDKTVAQEVVNICKNHHEGLGKEESYPNGISGVSLTQLECVFIIAHAYVLELYRIAFNLQKIDQCFTNVAQKYSSGNFKPILAAFEKALAEDVNPTLA